MKIEPKTKDLKSRRKFLKNIAGVTFILGTGVAVPSMVASTSKNGSAKISAWVRIEPSGKIVILNPAAEMGQGSLTALAVIVAEEMEADWTQVRIEDSPIEPETYGLQWGGRLGGPMITVGSRTVRGYYHALRLAGAQVKKVLISAVADKWNIPASQLEANDSFVHHRSMDKKISYGKIAGFIQMPAELPKVDDADLKRPQPV